MTDALVEANDLRVPRGGREVLHGVSLRVGSNERVALVGPNAAGKSTLLSALGGWLPVSAGSVRLGGRALGDRPARDIAKDVALVGSLQETAPLLTVRESVELGRYPHTGPFRGLSAVDHDAVERALVDTSLQMLTERRLATLSAGERQRASLARALAQSPKILLLDEPSSHLDVGHALDLFAVLSAVADRGVAVIAVIHDLVAAARWSSRIVVLHEGVVIDDGRPADVMTGPALARAFGVSVEAAAAPGGAAWRFERRVAEEDSTDGR